MDLVASGSEQDRRKYEAALAKKAEELKAGTWKLEHDKNGKITFKGEAPARPEDKALGKIYDAIKGGTTVNVSLTDQPSAAIGTAETNTQTINMPNAELAAKSGIPGTSLADTAYHETYEAIKMQKEGVTDPQQAHLEALADTQVGGLLSNSPSLGIYNKNATALTGLAVPATFVKGNTSTEVSYILKVNPALGVGRNESGKQQLQRLSDAMTQGKANLTFGGIKRKE